MWLFTTMNGGLLNTANCVTAHAAVLLMHAWQAPLIDLHQLRALEIDGIWHVEMTTPKRSSTDLQLSRKTGRVFRLASQPAN